MKICKWGILGPGKIANKFAVALTQTEGARLEAVASRDAGRSREFAAAHGAARWYDNYEQLAADPAIDAVYIATPHGFHAEHALLCLRHGKAVLCEKPMALFNGQVREMVDAARTNNVFLMEAMWTRFLPIMEKTMELIREGRIGSVRQVRADFGFLAPFNPDGRLYNLRLGGGSLLDIGVYPLFLCLQLLGEPDSIRAAGHLAPTGADETCHALLQYHDGRNAAFSSTLACPSGIKAEICGTEGIIELPSPWYKNDKLVLRPGADQKASQPQTIQLEPMVNGFEYQIREVMQCLAEGRIESPKMSHAFSLTMSKVMDAIRGQIGVKYAGE
ncbi:MAG TPA: Gfo/Idh/MocA family oxidoreductase [Puia sp.]|jgi:predicted dehydrogenase